MSEDLPQSRSRYEVITTLGQGGMARVLLTMSRGVAGVTKLLVVKELKEELKLDPEFVTMFLDEARIAARLNHPNVIQTYEVSHDGAHPVIVMEYLEGQPLNLVLSRVKRSKMPIELHVYILSQAAAGLHYAHELKGFEGTALGLVHRDVSPQNVFVTYDGRVLVVDFGIAKAADSAGFTRAGVFKGKLGYAAPEQVAAHGTLDRRADVFALGVMLWEAIAEKRLTLGETELSVMNRRLQGLDPKIREAAPNAPEELCRICEKAMALDPDARFATAAELRAALETYLDTSRRVGPEDIGALVRGAFAEDRAKVRGLIESHIKALQSPAATGESPAPLVLPPTSEVTPPRREGSEPSDSTVKVAATTARPIAANKQGSSPIPKLVVGAAAVVGLVAFLAWRDSGPPAPAVAASGAASAPQAPATVEVTIEVEPSDARILLDGAAIARNPFRGVLPRTDLARTLRVTAPGFVTDERLVTFDRDTHLQLALRPEATTPTQVAVEPAAPSAPIPKAAQPAKASSTDTGAAPAGVPKATGSKPGDALSGPQQKQTRTIDEAF